MKSIEIQFSGDTIFFSADKELSHQKLIKLNLFHFTYKIRKEMYSIFFFCMSLEIIKRVEIVINLS